MRRAWERSTPAQQGELRYLLVQNRTLARAYQLKEELRELLHTPNGDTLAVELHHILHPTQPNAATASLCAPCTIRFSRTGTRSSLSQSTGPLSVESRHSITTGRRLCIGHAATVTMTTCFRSFAS